MLIATLMLRFAEYASPTILATERKLQWVASASMVSWVRGSYRQFLYRRSRSAPRSGLIEQCLNIIIIRLPV